MSLIGLLALLTAGIALIPTLGILGVFNSEVWLRDRPIANALGVREVVNGVIRLSDGRILSPAGVRRRESVSQGEFDDALRAIAAQGVSVIRDLGDGRAFVLAEPRFYNPCGTRGYGGNPWAHVAGTYLQCPLSELLIAYGYASPDLDQTQLTDRERWRLEGVGHATQLPERPRRISKQSNSLCYDASTSIFLDYDRIVESSWRSPPDE